MTIHSPRTTGAAKIGIVLIALWTAFGLLSSTHFFFRESAQSSVASFGDTASHVMLFYWIWALLTPPVIVVSLRAARGGSSAWRSWAALALLAPALIVAHGVLYAFLLRVLGISSTATVSVTALRSFVMRHGGGDLATFAVIVGICFLVEATRRARDRELAASALRAELARADLEVLRWQLHPHFLFNALNTVSTLVLKGETLPAERAISLISQYLRSALSQRADATVPLAEELAMVRRYVAIERLRFGEALRIEECIDADVLDARIPGLIVQPLVENAINHGFVRRPDSGPLSVTATRRNGRLRIIVTNPGGNGVGPLASAVSGDISGGRDTDCDDRTSDRFGIRYVRERLRQFYGDDASFDLLIGGGETVATLDIPIDGNTEGGARELAPAGAEVRA